MALLMMSEGELTMGIGSGAVPDYNGQFFAEEEDVVLVTIKWVVCPLEYGFGVALTRPQLPPELLWVPG
jgi:hypothetical protein